jgi:hypothetical protein
MTGIDSPSHSRNPQARCSWTRPLPTDNLMPDATPIPHCIFGCCNPSVHHPWTQSQLPSVFHLTLFPTQRIHRRPLGTKHTDLQPPTTLGYLHLKFVLLMLQLVLSILCVSPACQHNQACKFPCPWSAAAAVNFSDCCLNQTCWSIYKQALNGRTQIRASKTGHTRKGFATRYNCYMRRGAGAPGRL